MKKILWALVVLLPLFSCVDPVVPSFGNQDSFFLVDGTIADRPGYSEVRLQRSTLVNEDYRLLPVREAAVVSVGEDGSEVAWAAVEGQDGLYVAPEGFAAVTGQEYYLRATLSDGLTLESEPEVVLAGVEIDDVEFDFRQESYFRSAIARFVPAFHFMMSYRDPAEVDNFYRTKFRYWETVNFCTSCEFGRFRDGECIPDRRNNGFWWYRCDGTCYDIKFGGGQEAFDDEFTDGNLVSGIELARIDHLRNTGGFLFEAELQHISPRAHRYITTLSELATDGGGLNATIPAALVGNVRVTGGFTENESPPLSLGYVNVAGTTTRRLYFEREDIDGAPLPLPIRFREEPGLPGCPEPIGCPEPAPCEESYTRTAVEPEGWGG